MNTLRQSAENKNRITALYARLSVDDATDTTSNSIINQQKILEDYAAKNGFTNARFFADDGYSGTRWDRPSWTELIAEVEAGNVQTVITKDMSRVGRDYLQVGFYTEVMFRKHGVRFIAVCNNIDSDNKESAEFAPFLNLMSEWYARDISRKISSAFQAKGNSGKPLTSTPIYGYKKDPNDKDKWLIDEEAAAVVRRIFQMTVDGLGPAQIARVLHDEKVLRVSCHLAKLSPRKLSEDTLANPYFWETSSVARILEKPEYAGHTVNFKTSRESYKDKNSKYNDKEDWKYFLDTHEAIVDQETFNAAQRLRKVVRRPNDYGDANPLTGIVHCVDCGRRMHNHRRSTDSYECSTYNISKKRYVTQCSMHFIRTEVLRELVLDSIRRICGYVKENQAEFIEKVRAESILRHGEVAKSQKKTIAKNQRRIAELDLLFKKAFEQNATGKLSDSRYEQMTADYENEQATLISQTAEMQSELDEFTADGENVESFIDLVKKYTEFTELTAAMLNSFVSRIDVHEATKNEWGERMQTVDIHFNFIGNFVAPIEETPLTSEEQKELDKLRAKRIRQREYDKQNKNRQRREIPHK
jgi:DNA invertase Pin-like site-specific DNA recombinase